ncbi:3-oxoacyl-[acyl-carrier protein] reductase [Mycobacterium sp. BK558]|nr:3-oxoacyl-[acyl-carrier protein] reductase [Mycobacterium sp. BK558]
MSADASGRPTVALVTGAGGGIGRAVVRTFLQGGTSVALVDTDSRVHDEATDLAAEFADLSVRAYTVDITEVDQVAVLADRVAADFGRLDALCLVAGAVQTAAGIAELTPAEWQRVIAVNLSGAYAMTHALVPLLRQDGGGSITAVSSWWGRSGHAYFAAYCAPKAGLIVFIQSLADELAPTVRANTVCPGNIDTSMHRAALESEAATRGVTFDEIKKSEWAKIPLGKAGSPRDIAHAIAFLSSPDAAYITGASLDVNGGVVYH